MGGIVNSLEPGIKGMACPGSQNCNPPGLRSLRSARKKGEPARISPSSADVSALPPRRALGEQKTSHRMALRFGPVAALTSAYRWFRPVALAPSAESLFIAFRQRYEGRIDEPADDP